MVYGEIWFGTEVLKGKLEVNGISREMKLFKVL